MAVDTQLKRMSAISLSLPFRGPMAPPDIPGVSHAERQAVSHYYSGIAAHGLNVGLVANWQENGSQQLVDQITSETSDQSSDIESSGEGRPGTALVSDDASGSVRYYTPEASWGIGTSDWTVSFWIKLSASTSGNRYVFSSQGTQIGNIGVSILTQSDEDIAVYMRDAAAGSTLTFAFATDLKLTVGEWTHVVVRCDRDSATGMDLWINGVQHTETKDPTSQQGSLTTSGNWYFHASLQGSTSNYALWNRVLAESDISALYNDGWGRQYPFNDQSAQRVTFDIPTSLTFQRMIDRLDDVQSASCLVAHEKVTDAAAALMPGDLQKKANSSQMLKFDGVLSFYESNNMRKDDAASGGAFVTVTRASAIEYANDLSITIDEQTGKDVPCYQGGKLVSSGSVFTPETNSAIAVRDDLEKLYGTTPASRLSLLQGFLTDVEISAILWTTPQSSVGSGSITAFANAGGGKVTVTSADHGLSDGIQVTITGTTNYNGTFTVSNVTVNKFDITDTWVSDDATGTWDATRRFRFNAAQTISFTNPGTPARWIAQTVFFDYGGVDDRELDPDPNSTGSGSEMESAAASVDGMDTGFRYFRLGGEIIRNMVDPAASDDSGVNSAGRIQVGWDGSYSDTGKPARQHPGFSMSQFVTDMTDSDHDWATIWSSFKTELDLLGSTIDRVQTDQESFYNHATLRLGVNPGAGGDGEAIGGLGNAKACTAGAASGSVTQFEDKGGTPNVVRVHSNNNYIGVGRSITISGTTNYNGTYTVTGVDTAKNDWFEIETAFNGNDATGTWQDNNKVRLTVNTAVTLLECGDNVTHGIQDVHEVTVAGFTGKGLPLNGNRTIVKGASNAVDLVGVAYDSDFNGQTGTWRARYAPRTLGDLSVNNYDLNDVFSSAQLDGADKADNQSDGWRFNSEQGNEWAAAYCSLMENGTKEFNFDLYQPIYDNFTACLVQDYSSRGAVPSIYPGNKVDNPYGTVFRTWRHIPTDAVYHLAFAGYGANGNIPLSHDRRVMRETQGAQADNNWDLILKRVQALNSEQGAHVMTTATILEAFARGAVLWSGTSGTTLTKIAADQVKDGSTFGPGDVGKYLYIDDKNDWPGTLYKVDSESNNELTLLDTNEGDPANVGSPSGNGTHRLYDFIAPTAHRHYLRFLALANFDHYEHWWANADEPTQDQIDWIDDVFSEVETQMGGTAGTPLVGDRVDWDEPDLHRGLDIDGEFKYYAVVRYDLIADVTARGTDLASSDSSDEIVSSASYSFDEADVGLWIHILSVGTNGPYTLGAYQIQSVDGSGNATVDRPVGGTDITDGDWQMLNYGDDGTDAYVSTNRHGTNLTIDDNDASKVSTASYTFLRSDIGHTLRIITDNSKFTAGDYIIKAVKNTYNNNGTLASSQATLDSAAGTTGETGGEFAIQRNVRFANATITHDSTPANSDITENDDGSDPDSELWPAAWITQTDLEPAS